ncbi:hypothetical protein EHS25_006835 [Saitozyma podzolica]|uniref:Uncharacterized protein n=1 Tax=Saitozyma podzolica TaxID=1890683 RepID=A0A427XRP7_9TREE|nr:hypothetical protein EHS25_006835 [Saitozyma podzolica]
MSPTKRSPSSSPAPTTPTKKKASNSSSAVTPSPKRSKESFPIEAKRAIIERALDMAYKNLPWGELAKELGISESRLKDQLKPSRANLRKAVVDNLT